MLPSFGSLTKTFTVTTPKKTHGKTECSNQEEICRNELQCLHSAYTTDVQLQVSSHKLLMLLYSELQWL